MNEQGEHRQRLIYLKGAKPEDFMNAQIGDWIQYVGDITTHYELNFVRNFGGFLCSFQCENRSTPAPASELAKNDPCSKCPITEHGSKQCEGNPCGEKTVWYQQDRDRTIREDERLKENARVLEKLNNRKILYSTQYVSMSIEMCEMGKIRIEEIEGIIESLRLPQPSASEATTTTTEQQQVKR